MTNPVLWWRRNQNGPRGPNERDPENWRPAFGQDTARTVNRAGTDEGIVLGARRHGEANAILEMMTRTHGRHLGLVRGGAGTRMRPVLQPGNAVRVTWRARLDEHLGHYTGEGQIGRAT